MRIGEGGLEGIDFSSLRQVRVHAIMVEALDSPLADAALMQGLRFIKEMRSIPEGQSIEYYIAVPLFSWRNGIGVKTSAIRDYL